MMEHVTFSDVIMLMHEWLVARPKYDHLKDE